MNCDHDLIKERCIKAARCIAERGLTVRAAAKELGISKSTVHKDVSERLTHIDRELYERVELVLIRNKKERHLRGGEATKRKYLRNKQMKPTQS